MKAYLKRSWRLILAFFDRIDKAQVEGLSHD
jgi:hypothetical protein